MDWLDLLTTQGTLKSVLQHHSSKPSVPWWSAFFMVQMSHTYMTTGKTIAFTIWTFEGKVTSLLFNIPSRFVIVFLPKTKHLLISWLQSPSEVTLEPKKIKSVTVSIVSPSICPSIWSDGISCHYYFFFFLILSFQPAFPLSSFNFIKSLFSSLCFPPVG